MQHSSRLFSLRLHLVSHKYRELRADPSRGMPVDLLRNINKHSPSLCHLLNPVLQPVKEPPPAAEATTVDEKKDATEKGEDKGPYAQDLTDGSKQVTGSAEGGRGVWGWLKGLSGADKDEKSAHQIYTVIPWCSW